MSKLFVTLLAALLMAMPALALTPAPVSSEVPADQAAVGAPPVDDALSPAWDPTIQQAAGEQRPGDGQDAIDPDATLPPVPSVVMELVAQQKPLTGVKVGIDPGHQAKGNNQKETVAPNSKKTKPKVSSGTAGISTRIPEYKTVLEISLKLRDALEEQGAEVYMTRETHDVDISNQERAIMMNEYGVDLVLRLHCNSYSSSSKKGAGVWVRKTGPDADACARAAELVLQEVLAATSAKDDGVHKTDTYTGDRKSTRLNSSHTDSSRMPYEYTW